MSKITEKIQKIGLCLQCGEQVTTSITYTEARKILDTCKQEMIKAIEDNQADTPARQQAIKTIKGVV